jgi:Caffeine-induced death protein 2
MPSRHPSTRPIPPPACNAFKSAVLLPTWHARTALLEYCTHVATSPDPDDPTLPLRQLESEADKNRVVNERLDPYSGRFFPREARTERLGSTLRLEWGVERIVRRRTWAVVGERCGEGEEMGVDGLSAASSKRREGWEVALDKWREENRGLVEGNRR